MKQVTASTFKYGSLAFASIVALLPLLLIVFGAFKDYEEYVTTSPMAPPRNWLNFDNFVKAFVDGGMALAFVNTVFILAVATAGGVLTSAFAAYALDRFEFRGRKLVLGLFLLAALVPEVTTQVSTFQLIKGMGLYNTQWALIVLFMGTGIVSIYIFSQFIRALPQSLDEAAMIDGAGQVRIFFRIVLPNLKPAIATVVIIKGIAMYNEFYLPFLYLSDADLRPISTTLFAFKGQYGSQWEVICAGVILTIVPILVLFLFLQRYVYNGFTAGATK
ncbi:carbohydrate ABC transporter permease [Microbacterium immunditiarum]|uniref:Multiple sugar transport system permease protein n=1 Tax=Microbacterium immunditiarum TaxID=337480 RepID=A0A7Y9GSA4_9MICO|nr:carbohydrate ABC transporter permease [Microbacterium immunditiarum]NYE21567.1 multiple sugar transport system permease protein [Microbacterium immunditiarum]